MKQTNTPHMDLSTLTYRELVQLQENAYSAAMKSSGPVIKIFLELSAKARKRREALEINRGNA